MKWAAGDEPLVGSHPAGSVWPVIHSFTMLSRSIRVFDVFERELIKERVLIELLKTSESGRGQPESFSWWLFAVISAGSNDLVSFSLRRFSSEGLILLSSPAACSSTTATLREGCVTPRTPVSVERKAAALHYFTCLPAGCITVEEEFWDTGTNHALAFCIKGHV